MQENELFSPHLLFQVAERIKAPERSTRMLLDYMVSEGYITKVGISFIAAEWHG